jgi:hypothetical protein
VPPGEPVCRACTCVSPDHEDHLALTRGAADFWKMECLMQKRYRRPADFLRPHARNAPRELSRKPRWLFLLWRQHLKHPPSRR